MTKSYLYYVLNMILVVDCILFLSLYSKAQGFIILNSYHSKSLNYFFNFATFLGDGLFTILSCICIFIFFRKHQKLAIYLLVAFALSGIGTQILKNLFALPRPSAYFLEYNPKYFIEVFSKSRAGYNSLPSGHTATAFACATVLVNYFRNHYLNIFAFLFGIVVGYSRIYLANHFLVDVVVGAVLGIISGVIAENVGNIIFLKMPSRFHFKAAALKINGSA